MKKASLRVYVVKVVQLCKTIFLLTYMFIQSWMYTYILTDRIRCIHIFFPTNFKVNTKIRKYNIHKTLIGY